eukprot:COSAG01_NODE_56079_length_320_cov_7.149321_1_plen_64_part_01
MLWRLPAQGGLWVLRDSLRAWVALEMMAEGGSHGSWAHLSYRVRSTPGDATSAETGLVLMRWRG